MVSRDGYPKGSGKRICHNQFFDLKRQGSIKDKTSFYLTSPNHPLKLSITCRKFWLIYTNLICWLYLFPCQPWLESVEAIKIGSYCDVKMAKYDVTIAEVIHT